MANKILKQKQMEIDKKLFPANAFQRASLIMKDEQHRVAYVKTAKTDNAK